LGAAVLAGAAPCFAEGRSGPEIFTQKCAACHKGGGNTVVGKGPASMCLALSAARMVVCAILCLASDHVPRIASELLQTHLVGSTGAGVWTLQTDALQKYGYDDVDSVSADCSMSRASVPAS